ncbi:MAG: hypothetical protein V7688_12640 [Alcanivorax jadensis]|uniref:hypothetical protein n=1 Tax=Alcanivorax jadensis TaxID=64988 RepID=UPI003002FDF2
MDKLKPCPNCGNLKHPDFHCTRCYPLNPVFVRKPEGNADTALAAAEARIAELAAERFTHPELDIIRQWHNAVKDVSPGYLNADGIDDDSVFRKVCSLLKEKE